MNDVTYLGTCCGLLSFLGSSVARRCPNARVLHSVLIVTIASLMFGLVMLASR